MVLFITQSTFRFLNYSEMSFIAGLFKWVSSNQETRIAFDYLSYVSFNLKVPSSLFLFC